MSDIDAEVKLSATRATISSPCKRRATIEEIHGGELKPRSQ